MKKKNKKRLIRIIIFFIIILLMVLIGLILFQTGVLKKKKVVSFEIRDPCSYIMDHLLHQIKDKGGCIIMCRNECELKKMDFLKSEFTKNPNACNTCRCYCK